MPTYITTSPVMNSFLTHRNGLSRVIELDIGLIEFKWLSAAGRKFDKAVEVYIKDVWFLRPTKPFCRLLIGRYVGVVS